MKRAYQILITISILFIGIRIAKAQSPRLPLDSVIMHIANNPALQFYDAKIATQDIYASAAKNLDAPKISAGQYQTPYEFNPRAGSFMINAEQMFTNPAKLIAKENYLKAISAVTVQDKNFFKNQLIAQAKQAYYDRVVLEKKIILLQNTQRLLEYMLKDATIRLTYGKEKTSNIYKAKGELYKLENTQEKFENEIRQKNIIINTLMNREKQTSFDIDTLLIIKDYETQANDSGALASSRSDIRGINRMIELQELNAKIEYNKRKPDFGLQAAHMISYGGFPNQYILMGTVTIPIVPWASKEYKANLKAVRYEVQELQQKKLDLFNQTEGRLASLKESIKSIKLQLNNYQQRILPAIQGSYKTALLAYEQNTGELSSVFEGIKDLQTSKMESLDLMQELLELQVAYEKEYETY